MSEDFGKPYPGVPPSKTKEMESCVSQVMSDPKMKSKYPDEKKRKSHAIAICHSSIVGKDVPEGKSNKLDSNLKGGENIMSKDKTLQKEELVEKEEVKKEETETKDLTKSRGKKVEEKVEVEQPKVEPEAPKEEVKPEEKVETPVEAPVEAPKEEVVEEKVPEVAPEIPVELVEKKVDPKAGKTENPKHGKEGHVCDKDCPEYKEPAKKVEDAEKIDVKKISDLLTSFETKFETKLEEIKGLIKQAPTEGAAETTPKVVAKEAPKEEVKKVEKIESDTSSEGASDIQKIIAELKERVAKLEKSPAPSRVVVSKGFPGESGETDDLTKINNRLAELEKIRDSDPNFYMKSELSNEAWDLIAKKRALQTK